MNQQIHIKYIKCTDVMMTSWCHTCLCSCLCGCGPAGLEHVSSLSLYLTEDRPPQSSPSPRPPSLPPRTITSVALWDGRETDSVGHSCVDTDDAVGRRPEEDHCVRWTSPHQRQ